MPAVVLLAVAVAVSWTSVAGAVDITACHQEVPAGQVGILTTDLDCGWNTVEGSYGVELQRNATLDMQGHTISGSQWAVYCPGPGRCTVTSTTATPGTLTAAEAGIWTPGSKVVVSNVHITNNTYGISNNPKATLSNVTFVDNGFAFTTGLAVATDVTVSGPCYASYCIDLGKGGKLDNLVTTATGTSGNVVQTTRSVKLRNPSMTGGGGQAGILAKSIRIRGGSVTGHAIDLAASSLRLVDVACDRSLRFDRNGLQMGTWGLCAND